MSAGPSAAEDVAVWRYGAHQRSRGELAAQFDSLPGDARRLYRSVEDGPRFLLDEPHGVQRLTEVLDLAHERGLQVEAMLLILERP